ncbi:MAG: Uma2 family endonuclease [Chloroflexota bacterium]
MVTTGRRYVMADLLDFPDDDKFYDIVGGELIMYNVPELDHGLVATGLAGLLWAADLAGYGVALTNTHAVALDFPAKGWAAEYVTHPDHSFVRRGREGILGQRAVEGVPDLVVEVLSPSTRDEHAIGGAIRAAYERHGVPHYWLVDLEQRTVEQYGLLGELYQGGRYGAPIVLHVGDVLTSALFPTVSLPMAVLFQHVRRRQL